MMSPWLFNLYIDGVVREVNARVLGRGLRGRMPEKSTFLRNWHPVRGPMSFAAKKGKRKRVKIG